jgi:coproporphyrinogen III oxidase
MPQKEQISNALKALQTEITTALEQLDGKGSFKEDVWERPGGGGGRSRALTGGAIIEKGGVNFSAVHGAVPEKISAGLGITGSEFYATGVSIVLHPHNPHMPIIHMNVRYFEIDSSTWWFGGGIDLTPHYVVPEQAVWFHQQLKTVCDKHSPSFYPEFKSWADKYFYLPHRKETRGVGGIFYDRLTEVTGLSKHQLLNFTLDLGHAFVPIYTELAKLNAEADYTTAQQQWQAVRRGRYVEFNLVWDKGTLFGLQTDGRTESILMSMPPMAEWKYNFEPQEASPEAATQAILQADVDWLATPEPTFRAKNS